MSTRGFLYSCKKKECSKKAYYCIPVGIKTTTTTTKHQRKRNYSAERVCLNSQISSRLQLCPPLDLTPPHWLLLYLMMQHRDHRVCDKHFFMKTGAGGRGFSRQTFRDRYCHVFMFVGASSRTADSTVPTPPSDKPASVSVVSCRVF